MKAIEKSVLLTISSTMELSIDVTKLSIRTALKESKKATIT